MFFGCCVLFQPGRLPAHGDIFVIRVGIVGATGYGGRELLRLLLAHPGVEVVAVASTVGSAVAVASTVGVLSVFVSDMDSPLC